MFLWVQRVSNGQLRLLFSITIREFALTSFIYSKMALQGDRSFWTLWSCSYMILDSGKLMRQLRSALQRGSGCFAQYSISDGTFLILGGQCRCVDARILFVAGTQRPVSEVNLISYCK